MSDCRIEYYCEQGDKAGPWEKSSSFTSKTFFSRIYVLYHEGGYTLVHEHVYRVYSAALGLQFACTPNSNLACAFLTYMRALCTCLVRTRELCTICLMSAIFCTDAGLHVCGNEKRVVSCPCCMRVLSILN